MASNNLPAEAHLLRIPPEIRNKIYKTYLRSLSAYAHADDQRKFQFSSTNQGVVAHKYKQHVR